jgi:hypothetical protein
MFAVLKKDYFGQKAGTTLDIDEPHTKSLLEQGIVEAVKGDPYGPLMAKEPIKISNFLWTTERC